MGVMEIINIMKNIIYSVKKLLALIALASLTSCYEDFVEDYDQSGAYIAYQYDLRTFVIGENDDIQLPVALAGVMENSKDRSVTVSIDDSLLTKDISTIIPLSTSFYAIDGLKGKAPVGLISGTYVTSAIKSASITSPTPIPAEYYTVEGLQGLKFSKGSHSTHFSITINDNFKTDPNAFVPYYAIAYKIEKADVDSIPAEKSFSIVALKCENRFFGYWRRSGVVTNFSADGTEVDSEYTPDSWADAGTYYLSTVDGSTVTSNKTAGETSNMMLTFDGNNITISSESGNVNGTGSFNGKELLQDREIYLQYTVKNQDNSYSEVTDTLRFRNRIRDGVNEWEDENPEHYQ